MEFGIFPPIFPPTSNGTKKSDTTEEPEPPEQVTPVQRQGSVVGDVPLHNHWPFPTIISISVKAEISQRGE
jgi:hypothetical protein